MEDRNETDGQRRNFFAFLLLQLLCHQKSSTIHRTRCLLKWAQRRTIIWTFLCVIKLCIFTALEIENDFRIHNSIQIDDGAAVSTTKRADDLT
jgi:hypothetical protein